MNTLIFTSPEEAESALYEAIASADLDRLMAIWAEDEDISCIHPTGQRLVGHAAVRESWRGVFSANPRLRIDSTQGLHWNSALMAVSTVVETLYVGDDPQPHGPMLATNVYVRGARGWRLLTRHVSASSEPVLAEAGTPRILH